MIYCICKNFYIKSGVCTMKFLQKSLSLILLLSLILSLASCDSKPEAPAEPSSAPLPEQKVLIDTEGMTDLQKAVIITAESYYLRGKYAQYSQGKRACGIRAPEDYTEQAVGYTDCSAFVWDVYYFSLGIDMSNGSANTAYYCANPGYAVLYEEPLKDNFAAMSGKEQAAKLKEFRDTLQPGDVIVYRYADGNNGHAMLYVGNGMIIHSTGSDSKTEENGTVLYDSILTTLLSPSSSRSILTKSVYVILRPLLGSNGEIPAHTRQRMELMRGIVAEKLCTHTLNQPVAPGETMTFTFRIRNRSNREKVLTVTDTVPENTTYVSGAQQVNGTQLSWTVTVPAGGSTEVSYCVQVDPSAPVGQYIFSNSEVSGIAVNCTVVQILKRR